MPRISIAKKHQQFGYKLLIIALIVVIIFAAWYTYEKFTKPVDGMQEAVQGIEQHEDEQHVEMIPGDDLREHKEFLKLAAEQLMKDGFQENAVAEEYVFHNNIEGEVLNLEEAKTAWENFIAENGEVLSESIKYEVLGNGVKIVFKTADYQGENQFFRRHLVFEGFETDQKLLLIEDVLSQSREAEKTDTLGVGETLPSDLQFKGYFDKQISDIDLNDTDGKWKLLFFYPADFTTVCPTECLALKEFYPEFKNLNTEVYGISTDPVNVHKAWVDYYFGPMPYALLADPDHKLASMFDFWSEKEGVALRGTAILNPENQIVFMSAQENNTGRSIEEYLRMLIAIQTPGLKVENWQAGESTL
jgi:peroxiredoxin 2/4